MHGYSKTFKRRWPLYVLIPLVAAIAVGFLGVSSKSYESSASLWVDYDASSSSSLNVTETSGETAPPSTIEQTTLTELLSTTAFGKAVAARAGVPAGQQSAVAGALSKSVTSTAPGPQVLNLSYTSASAAESQKMVQSLITELQVWTDKFEHKFDIAATHYSETLYKSAVKAVAGAKQAVNAYHRTHPNATAQNDQTYASLISALATASSSLASDRTTLNQQMAASAGNSAPATISVVDGASPGVNAHSSKKKVIIKALGAGIGGALVSLILVVAFTPSVRRDDDEYAEDVAIGGVDRRRLDRESRTGASSSTWTPPNATRPSRALPTGRRQLEDGSDDEDLEGTPRAIRVAQGHGRQDPV